MKRCPQCDLTYIDESVNFCLTDGTELIPLTAVSQATVVVPKPPPEKKSRAWLWAALVILVLLGGAVVVAAVVLYVMNARGETAAANHKGGTNTTQSPKPTPTPKATPSPAAAVPSPPVPGNKTNSADDGSDDVIPIAWNTPGTTFKAEDGKVYKFLCPPGETPGGIWGSDIYTADSSICTAAVHAGVITLAEGGPVTLEFRPGRSAYGSTTRNGITSYTFGEYNHSFVVRAQ